MQRVLLGLATAAFVAVSGSALAQTPQPQIAVTKVDGTDNVYIFRNGGHQAMFIVTKDGVIATDPVAYGRPTGGQQYVDEIKKITDKPIKYLIYSHVHFDHIAGGKAFKDAGARVIAHKNATARLKTLKDPHTVIPDESVGNKKVINLGGTTLELHYLGLNHSDSTLVMRLPKEKIVMTVDRHANTSAASVPLALDTAVRDGRIKRGDLIVLEAMGGGFTWGAAALRY